MGNVDINNKAQAKTFPKTILCPECDGEKNCIIDICDYKITLNGCDNNHNPEKILLENYLEKAKNVDDSKIKCEDENCEKIKSESYNKTFYRCLNCKKNICPLHKNSHNEHTFINYDLKNYLCDKHNSNVACYCKQCHKNLCVLCSYEDDEAHELINLVELYRKNKVINNLDILRKAIDDSKNIANSNDVKFDDSQKAKFEKTVNNLDIYYKISENILNYFDLKKTNYQNIISRINVYKGNITIIEDLDKIIKETKVEDKIKKIMDLEAKMN